MSVKEYSEKILKELLHNLQYANNNDFDAFVSEILSANHIFTAGAGRSGVSIRAFTNRLMHLGLAVSMV